jgi:hypothetical protein
MNIGRVVPDIESEMLEHMRGPIIRAVMLRYVKKYLSWGQTL